MVSINQLVSVRPTVGHISLAVGHPHGSRESWAASASNLHEICDIIINNDLILVGPIQHKQTFLP